MVEGVDTLGETLEADVLVIGSGVTGCSRLCAMRSRSRRIVLVCFMAR